ncbi:MAG: adenylate kinase [Alphaproteobacteria bacterium]|nr:adenylate kinase [Alphaproteobacteria bacterium]
MIILISGASHTGKTLLAQKLLEKYKYPILSIDLLKMGLIRSNNTSLTPEDDESLEKYLWPIVREMIKTATENKQNLIVEGAYIPFDWKKDFDLSYLKTIQFYCLVMTQNYIQNHFTDIKNYANIIENRLDDSWFTKETALEENIKNLRLCKQNNCHYVLIDDSYDVDIEIN